MRRGRWHAACSEVSIESVIAFVCLQVALLSLVIFDLVLPLTTQLFAIGSFSVLSATAYLTWKQTQQGNHPIFLFMVFLALFQYGRLFSWFISGDWTLTSFNLAVGRAFTVPDQDVKRALMLVPLSATFVYLGFFATAQQRVLTFARDNQMRSFFGWLYFLTIPCVVIKDVSYLRYVLEHGGYLAAYLDQGEHIEQVGSLIRGIALFNVVAFLPYLIVENRRRYLVIAIVSYLAVLVLELLVGVRGKFFINVMLLWMVYNIKIGKSFKPITALAAGMILLTAAVAAEIFRESKSALDVNIVGYFFYTQGNSFYVTLASLMFYDVFHGHALGYLANQFLVPFQHISKFDEGTSLSLDLTFFLNPASAKYGFGTGDSYLANLYLMGGAGAVCIGSWLLGAFCSAMTRAHTVFWRTIALSVLMWVPYMPRSGYLEPLANGVKYFIMAVSGFAMYAVFAWLKSCLDTPLPRLGTEENATGNS